MGATSSVVLRRGLPEVLDATFETRSWNPLLEPSLAPCLTRSKLEVLWSGYTPSRTRAVHAFATGASSPLPSLQSAQGGDPPDCKPPPLSQVRMVLFRAGNRHEE
eukprot:14654494-Alexandrium_andersonii.AAC.1